jgi:hypothetical protein
MPAYRVASLGPIIRGIENRQARLRAIRPRVKEEELKSLDLRMEALEESRQALVGRCLPGQRMTALFTATKKPVRK